MTASRIPCWCGRLAVGLLFLLGNTGRVQADLLYGADGAGQTNSNLYLINPTTGAATTIGSVTLFVNGINEGALALSALAYDPQNGLLYASTTGSTNANLPNASLVTLTTTANGQGQVQATPVGQPFTGSSGGTFNMASLAFNPSGAILFGYTKPSEALDTVSLTGASAGVATKVGASGISGGTAGDGMAINAVGSNAGTLYFAGKGVGGPLYTLNASTGAATAGPTLTAPSPPPDLSTRQIKGLGFNSSGNLYGIALAAGSTAPIAADLVTINPTTGAITEVGTTHNGLLALAFEPSSSSVPEPSTFILLGLPAAGWALWTLVRCKRSLARS